MEAFCPQGSVDALEAFGAGKDTPRKYFVYRGVVALEAFCVLDRGLLGSILCTRDGDVLCWKGGS